MIEDLANSIRHCSLWYLNTSVPCFVGTVFKSLPLGDRHKNSIFFQIFRDSMMRLIHACSHKSEMTVSFHHVKAGFQKARLRELYRTMSNMNNTYQWYSNAS